MLPPFPKAAFYNAKIRISDTKKVDVLRRTLLFICGVNVRKCQLFLSVATALALLFASGAQWFVLQSVAWTGMLISYSKDASLVEAVQKTFDGNHPCSLCEHIRSAEKETPKKDQLSQHPPVVVILGTLVESTTVEAPAHSARLLIETCDATSPSRFEEPLSPPPRRLA